MLPHSPMITLAVSPRAHTYDLVPIDGFVICVGFGLELLPVNIGIQRIKPFIHPTIADRRMSAGITIIDKD
jgi:hypothetical protein